MPVKKYVSLFLAEMLGTFTLGSVILAVTAHSNLQFFAAIAAGLTYATLMLVLGPLSRAHLNPAVTVGLFSLRKVPVTTALLHLVAQFVGGFAALKISSYLMNSTLQGLANTSWDWRIFIAEALGALVFTLGVTASLSREYNKPARALLMGASLSIGSLLASLGSAGIINPAIAVAVNNVSLTYIIAPLVGGIAGMYLYRYIFLVPESKVRTK